MFSDRRIEYKGMPAGIATIFDINEIKKAEEQIRASLMEKEVLLKEIHHRVKNNLQIISTLLDLQSESIKDKEALRAFRESQDRIKAMALVHEKLYQSTDLSSIDLAEYIEKLTYFLFNSYIANSERITLKVDVGHLHTDIDRAIPCGLIINELATNALKHAFPDGRKGEITIRFNTGEDGSISLLVGERCGVSHQPGFPRDRDAGPAAGEHADEAVVRPDRDGGRPRDFMGNNLQFNGAGEERTDLNPDWQRKR